MTENAQEKTMPQDTAVDVAVVGGGAAGLSAALVLARSRRSVLVIDAGEPRNAPADAIHNYLGREGATPSELVAVGRAEVESYGAVVVEGRVTAAVAAPAPGPGRPRDLRFELTLDDGRRVVARRVVLATGVRDALPDVPGLTARWGRDVLHCPYCHGWEVRDRRIGILASGPAAMHQVGLFRQLSASVTLLANGTDAGTGHGDRARLAARGVEVVPDAVEELLVAEDAVVGVRVAGGRQVPLDAVVVASFPDASCHLATDLGLGTRDLEMGGHVIARSLDADPQTGATSVPGVLVVGNAAMPMGTTIAAAASGTQAGAILNAQLVEEDTTAALALWRAAQNEPGPWDERYADRVWSGRVNPRLPEQVAVLAPGRALDVGCGEGADALWLAEHGWDVTGVDFSATGLARAAEHAAEAGVADRTHWRREDVRTWQPDTTWDLVTTHYLHLADTHMPETVGRLAAAVAPGGTLLVVLHHPEDVLAGGGAGGDDDAFPSPELVRAVEQVAGPWDVRTEVVERVGTGHGPDVVVRDVVLVARRG